MQCVAKRNGIIGYPSEKSQSEENIDTECFLSCVGLESINKVAANKGPKKATQWNN